MGSLSARVDVDVDAMLKECAERIADATGALSSRCVLLVGRIGAMEKMLAEARRENEGLKKRLNEEMMK